MSEATLAEDRDEVPSDDTSFLALRCIFTLCPEDRPIFAFATGTQASVTVLHRHRLQTSSKSDTHSGTGRTRQHGT